MSNDVVDFVSGFKDSPHKDKFQKELNSHRYEHAKIVFKANGDVKTYPNSIPIHAGSEYNEHTTVLKDMNNGDYLALLEPNVNPMNADEEYIKSLININNIEVKLNDAKIKKETKDLLEKKKKYFEGVKELAYKIAGLDEAKIEKWKTKGYKKPTDGSEQNLVRMWDPDTKKFTRFMIEPWILETNANKAEKKHTRNYGQLKQEKKEKEEGKEKMAVDGAGASQFGAGMESDSESFDEEEANDISSALDMSLMGARNIYL